MPERQRPITTELALADALDRLVNLIEEPRIDAGRCVEITTDETLCGVLWARGNGVSRRHWTVRTDAAP